VSLFTQSLALSGSKIVTDPVALAWRHEGGPLPG
jgi:hypothetical protein